MCAVKFGQYIYPFYAVAMCSCILFLLSQFGFAGEATFTLGLFLLGALVVIAFLLLRALWRDEAPHANTRFFRQMGYPNCAKVEKSFWEVNPHD